MKKLKQIKGITLIALTVTIIVLLILAGITLSLVFNKQGLIKLAQQAGENYINAEDQEKKSLEDLYSSMLVATNDNATITISMEDLNSLIDAKVEEKISSLSIGNNMSSPVGLVTAKLSMTNSSTRDAGTYKASSSLYTKKKYLKNGRIFVF